MIEINPKIEILYDDLVSLGIGDFLLSRDFQRMALQINFSETWKKLLNRIDDNRTVVLAWDTKKWDALDALKVVCNDSLNDKAAKSILFRIILYFIASKNQRTDFSEVIDSLKLVQFGEEYRQSIQDQIVLHQDKYPLESFSPKEESGESQIQKTITNRVFIVHGHDDGKLQTVARLIEKQGLKPIILKEQPSDGLTVIEKFETHSNSDFAIILLTGDDHGNVKSNMELLPRARQNVIFEMGYFFALLGRKNVACLHEPDIEVPSDLAGRMYIKWTEDNDWKLRLIKEMQSAGLDVSADKI